MALHRKPYCIIPVLPLNVCKICFTCTPCPAMVPHARIQASSTTASALAFYYTRFLNTFLLQLCALLYYSLTTMHADNRVAKNTEYSPHTAVHACTTNADHINQRSAAQQALLSDLGPCGVDSAWSSDVQRSLVPEFHSDIRLNIPQGIWICTTLRHAAVSADHTAHVCCKAILQVLPAALHGTQAATAVVWC